MERKVYEIGGDELDAIAKLWPEIPVGQLHHVAREIDSDDAT